MNVISSYQEMAPGGGGGGGEGSGPPGDPSPLHDYRLTSSSNPKNRTHKGVLL